MAAVDVYLSLGTNLGKRERNIRIALNFLNLMMGSHYTALSDIIETEAVGFDGPAFMNCVVRYRTSKSARSILAICKKIEKEMGRDDAPEYDAQGQRVYHDRIIDIDILLYGNSHVRSEEITIPHPQLENRPFFGELISQIS